MKALRLFFLTGFILLTVGCASTRQTITVDPDHVMVFPLPPAEPRIQFLRKFSSSSDVEKSASWLDRFIVGVAKVEQLIIKPYGIAIKDGRIYVCDTIMGGLEIIDLKNRSFHVFKPFGRGTLRKPVNVALDDRGRVYIADTQREEVVVFGPDFKYKKVIKSSSLKPVDIAIHGDSLIIADLKDRNLEIWSIRDERKISDFPPNNQNLPDSVRLFVPISVDVDEENNIYVCDFGEFRVQKFDRRGHLVRSYGGIGRSMGKFARPKGIAVDKKQRLYVVDSAFENIQVFDKNGNLLMFFGGTYQRPGNMYLPAQVIVDYEHIDFFKPYVLPGYTLEYLILVTNQYGPDKIGVYGFINPVTQAK